MITIDRKAADEILDRVLVEYGEDYVYEWPEPGRITSCRYFNPETNEPGCIIGQIFARLGVTIEDLGQHNSAYTIWEVDRDPDLPIKVDSDTLPYLNVIQRNQDRGLTWGAAVRRAREDFA